MSAFFTGGYRSCNADQERNELAGEPYESDKGRCHQWTSEQFAEELELGSLWLRVVFQSQFKTTSGSESVRALSG